MENLGLISNSHRHPNVLEVAFAIDRELNPSKPSIQTICALLIHELSGYSVSKRIEIYTYFTLEGFEVLKRLFDSSKFKKIAQIVY